MTSRHAVRGVEVFVGVLLLLAVAGCAVTVMEVGSIARRPGASRPWVVVVPPLVIAGAALVALAKRSADHVLVAWALALMVTVFALLLLIAYVGFA